MNKTTSTKRILKKRIGFEINEKYIILANQRANNMNNSITNKEKFLMELKDTIEMMTSADYKERFKAEYYQVKIRYEKLKTMCDNWDAGVLAFTPTCPRVFYDNQLEFMKGYLGILVERAKMEKVILDL